MHELWIALVVFLAILTGIDTLNLTFRYSRRISQDDDVERDAALTEKEAQHAAELAEFDKQLDEARADKADEVFTQFFANIAAAIDRKIEAAKLSNHNWRRYANQKVARRDEEADEESKERHSHLHGGHVSAASQGTQAAEDKG